MNDIERTQCGADNRISRFPNSGRPSVITLTREPQTAFGWAKRKTIHVPAGWYPRESPYHEMLVHVEEQTGQILGWYGLHGEKVNVRVTVKGAV